MSGYSRKNAHILEHDLKTVQQVSGRGNPGANRQEKKLSGRGNPGANLTGKRFSDKSCDKPNKLERDHCFNEIDPALKPIIMDDKSFHREALILLRRLLRAQSFLRLNHQSGDYQIFSVKNHYKRPVACAPADLVLLMQRRLLLRTDKENIILGQARILSEFMPEHTKTNNSLSPLEWLYRHKDMKGNNFITKEQYEAGEKLNADYEKAQLERPITANWQSYYVGVRGTLIISDNGVAQLSNRQFTARCHVDKALCAVGPDYTNILLQICCLSVGLEEAERRLNLPKKHGKTLLSTALTRLADYYSQTI